MKMCFLLFLVSFFSRNEHKLLVLIHFLVAEQENILTLQGFYW